MSNEWKGSWKAWASPMDGMLVQKAMPVALVFYGMKNFS